MKTTGFVNRMRLFCLAAVLMPLLFAETRGLMAVKEGGIDSTSTTPRQYRDDKTPLINAALENGLDPAVLAYTAYSTDCARGKLAQKNSLSIWGSLSPFSSNKYRAFFEDLPDEEQDAFKLLPDDHPLLSFREQKIDGKKCVFLSFPGSSHVWDWHAATYLKSLPIKCGKIKLYAHGGVVNRCSSFSTILLDHFSEASDRNTLKKEYRECMFVFSGHSLGGACATLCAQIFKHTFNISDKKITLTTFAATPRLFHRGSSSCLLSIPQTYHFQFSYDPVVGLGDFVSRSFLELPKISVPRPCYPSTAHSGTHYRTEALVEQYISALQTKQSVTEKLSWKVKATATGSTLVVAYYWIFPNLPLFYSTFFGEDPKTENS